MSHIRICGVDGDLQPNKDGSVNPKRIETLKKSDYAILILSNKFWEEEGQTAEIDIVLDRKIPTLLIFDIHVMEHDWVRLCNLFDEYEIIYERININLKNEHWTPLVQILMNQLYQRKNR